MADNVAVLLAVEADMKALSEGGPALGEPAVVGSRKIHRLQIGPHRVHAVIMGAGCVETAITTEALLSRFRCDVVLSLGPAGGLTPAATRGAWFYITGCVVQGKSSGDGSPETPLSMPELPPTWVLTAPLAAASPALLTAGELFVSQAAQRERLAAATGASLVDMNTHGLHAACANHQVPLHVWRVVSDHADELAGPIFRDFVKGYDGSGGRALAELIRNLPANPKAAGSYPGIQKLLKQPGKKEE